MAKKYNKALSMFNQIILAETGYNKTKRLNIIECNGKEKAFLDAEYITKLNFFNEGYEMIGMENQIIKPVFDCDPTFNINDDIDILKTINTVLIEIKNMYPDKNIYVIQRIRQIDDNIKKISFHITVDGVKTNIKTIKNKIIANGYKNDKPFDHSIYSENRGLYPIFSNRKKGIIPYIEAFKPIDIITGKILDWVDIDIKKYCPSYIEEDFEEDFMEPPTGPKEPNEPKKKQYDDDNKDNSNLNLEEIITHLNPKRANDRDDWLNGIYCVINCAENIGYGKKKQKDIAHLFSSICPEKYTEDLVEEWLDKNIDNKRENGYRWKYLLDCLKEDDIYYYNNNINCKKNKLLSYDDMKEEFEKNHFKLKFPAYFISIEDDSIICSKATEAQVSFENLQCLVPAPTKADKNKVEKKQFFALWRKDHNMKIHRKMGWKPPPLKMEHPDDFNLFEDFSIKKIPLTKTDRDYWNDYYTFALNLFGDLRICNYIISMMAYKLQNPAYRTEVLTILTGEEGDGKSMFLNTYFHLFDEKHTLVIQKLNTFFEDKSTVEYKKLLICLDDVSGNGNFEHDGELRARITASRLTVRPLYEDSKNIDNYSDLFYTTNQRNIVRMKEDAIRRFFQTETTSYYRGNTTFWNDYITNIYKNNDNFNPVAMRQIYEGLIQWKWKDYISKGFQDKEDKPMTEIMLSNMRSNRDKILYFYEDLTIKHEASIIKATADNDDIPPDECILDNKILFNRWNTYCKNSKINIDFNIIQFGIKTATYIKIIELKTNKKAFKKDTKHCKTIIYFDVLREYFDILNNED